MTQTRRHPQVVNVDEAASREESTGDFVFRTRRLGTQAGGRALGCSHYELAAGKTSFPFHFHSAFEEAIYVLDGTGTLRIGDARVELRSGDYVAFPAGPEHAHTITASSAGPLRYLCLSSPATPTTLDIVGYPDSKKVAFASGVDPVKGLAGGAWLRMLVKQDQPPVGYYDDEPLAKGGKK
jgi:uncharacterized cupin superfamily protein